MNNNKNRHLYYTPNRKNQRRISITISAQTMWHLKKMAVANGWSEKDLGHVVDDLMRTVLANKHQHQQEGSD